MFSYLLMLKDKGGKGKLTCQSLLQTEVVKLSMTLCLELAKKFSEAEAQQARAEKTRIELLKDTFKNELCVEGCDKRWIGLAIQLLAKNRITDSFFCNAIYEALKLGRGKYRNIYIHGPANCGKTFMISPLKIIYHAFVNPASGTFAWLGAEKAEVIILNDFR